MFFIGRFYPSYYSVAYPGGSSLAQKRTCNIIVLFWWNQSINYIVHICKCRKFEGSSVCDTHKLQRVLWAGGGPEKVGYCHIDLLVLPRSPLRDQLGKVDEHQYSGFQQPDIPRTNLEHNNNDTTLAVFNVNVERLVQPEDTSIWYLNIWHSVRLTD